MNDVFNLNFELSRVITSGATIIVIAIVAWFLARVAVRAIRSAVERRLRMIPDLGDEDRQKRVDTVAGTLGKVVKLAIWVIAAMTAMSEFGVNVGPIIAGMGIGGLALAFAAQNIIRDYLHGFLIGT